MGNPLLEEIWKGKESDFGVFGGLHYIIQNMGGY